MHSSPAPNAFHLQPKTCFCQRYTCTFFSTNKWVRIIATLQAISTKACSCTVYLYCCHLFFQKPSHSNTTQSYEHKPLQVLPHACAKCTTCFPINWQVIQEFSSASLGRWEWWTCVKELSYQYPQCWILEHCNCNNVLPSDANFSLQLQARTV